MKKADKSTEKSTKNVSIFCRNKPNFKNIKIGVSPFETSIYEILPAGSGEKTKPIQTQYKANTNPMLQRPKMNLNIYYTIGYNNETYILAPKTNPIQTQNKPNLETAHKSDIYQRNSLSHLFRRPIITCECYGHNEDITLKKQFL